MKKLIVALLIFTGCGSSTGKPIKMTYITEVSGFLFECKNNPFHISGDDKIVQLENCTDQLGRKYPTIYTTTGVAFLEDTP